MMKLLRAKGTKVRADEPAFDKLEEATHRRSGAWGFRRSSRAVVSLPILSGNSRGKLTPYRWKGSFSKNWIKLVLTGRRASCPSLSFHCRP